MSWLYATILRAPLSPIAFTLGPLAIHWYGLIIALALLLGYWLAKRLKNRRAGLGSLDIDELTPWLIIGGILGARLYYVLFRWDYYALNPVAIIKIWEGGLAIHGAFLGGLLTLFLYTRRRHLSLLASTDLLSLPLILGQALGRWGNFFNEEAFGTPTNLPWKLYVSSSKRPALFAEAEYFHPTFLYESIWNGLVFLLLIFLLYKTKRPGIVTACYLIFYSLGRLFIEGLRTDSLMLGPLRAAQLLSLILIVAGLTILFKKHRV